MRSRRSMPSSTSFYSSRMTSHMSPRTTDRCRFAGERCLRWLFPPRLRCAHPARVSGYCAGSGGSSAAFARQSHRQCASLWREGSAGGDVGKRPKGAVVGASPTAVPASAPWTRRSCSSLSLARDSSRSKPGTGLGLTIVDRIARAHGGTVESAQSARRRARGHCLVVDG